MKTFINYLIGHRFTSPECLQVLTNSSIESKAVYTAQTISLRFRITLCCLAGMTVFECAFAQKLISVTATFSKGKNADTLVLSGRATRSQIKDFARIDLRVNGRTYSISRRRFAASGNRRRLILSRGLNHGAVLVTRGWIDLQSRRFSFSLIHLTLSLICSRVSVRLYPSQASNSSIGTDLTTNSCTTATTQVTIAGNLDAEAPFIPVVSIPFPGTASPPSVTYEDLAKDAALVKTVPVIDSLGMSHDVRVIFFRTSYTSPQYTVQFYANNEELDQDRSGNFSGYPRKVGSDVTLSFSSTGLRTNPPYLDNPDIRTEFRWNNGSSVTEIEFTFAPISRCATGSVLTSVSHTRREKKCHSVGNRESNLKAAQIVKSETKACGIPTSHIYLRGNLDSTAPVIPHLPIISAPLLSGSTSLSFGELQSLAALSVSATVFDSLGKAHNVALYFFHTAITSPQFTLRVFANSEDVDVKGSAVGYPRQIGADLPLGFESNGSLTRTGSEDLPDLKVTSEWNLGSENSQLQIFLSEITSRPGTNEILQIRRNGTGGRCQ